MTAVEVLAPGELTADEWADRIRGHLARTVEAIVAAGYDLVEAKAQLAHGEWLPMLDKAGLAPRVAQQFMAITEHPALANASSYSHLPGAYNTLYELSRVDPSALEAAIADGRVRPDMTRSDAVALVREHNHTAGSNSPDATRLPEGTFATIVADPPWQYGNQATRAAAQDHYRTMDLDGVCSLLDDEDIEVATEAHCYLWTTNGFLREAFDVLAAWGFEYKTCLTWVKPQIGLGNYFRNSTEHILFGVRGGLRTNDMSTPTWFEAKRLGHSTKPAVFYDLVRRCSPGPYLELFGRGKRAGWTVWGDQADGVDADRSPDLWGDA